MTRLTLYAVAGLTITATSGASTAPAVEIRPGQYHAALDLPAGEHTILWTVAGGVLAEQHVTIGAPVSAHPGRARGEIHVVAGDGQLTVRG